MSKRPKSLRSAVLWTVLVLIAFLAADGLLFRTGWYFDYIEPDSSIGQLESHLNWLERTPKTPGEREVLVIGDSRIGEGLSVPIAIEAAGPRFRFWNFGIAGSTPRVWYYALRATDLDRSRFSAIVIALGQYTDEDDADNEADREIDLNFVIARLGLVDCFGFSRSFSTFAYQRRALVGCLFRGVTLRTDIKGFLLGVTRRVQKHNDWFENGPKYTTEYPGKPEDFTGQSVNFAMQMQRVPQTGATTRYRNQWLGNILDLYRDSATGIIFVQLPSPVHLPPSEVPARFLDAALQRPHVSAIPAESFADLETPELFADVLHLNRSGRAEFSRRLAKFVQAAVGDR